MSGEEDSWSLRGLPRELDGRLDRLCSRVAEEDPADLLAASTNQLLCEKTRQKCAVHLDHVRQVEIDRLMERLLERGVTPPECVDTESRKEVEIALALGVEQVAALPAHVEAIEPDRFEHAPQLVVQVLLMQCIVLAMTSLEQFGDV